MKLLVTCPSGLHIEFEGSYAELPHLDRFLEEIARVEAERLELRHQLDIAEHRIPVTFEWEPFPDPSPPAPPGVAAEPDGAGCRPDTPAAGMAGGSSRPPARTSPPAGGTGRPRQNQERVDRLLAAIGERGPCSIADVSDATGVVKGRVKKIVQGLVRDGLVVAEGATRTRRYRLAGDDNGGLVGEHDEAFAAGIDALSRAALAPAPEPEPAPPVVRRQQAPHEGRVIGASARAAMSAQLAERHGAHHAQALALVAEHGPVASVWVADQLVKNRRDTLALMRDMVVAGELAETDGYFNVPDRDDQAAAA